MREGDVQGHCLLTKSKRDVYGGTRTGGRNRVCQKFRTLREGGRGWVKRGKVDSRTGIKWENVNMESVEEEIFQKDLQVYRRP